MGAGYFKFFSFNFSFILFKDLLLKLFFLKLDGNLELYKEMMSVRNGKYMDKYK